jgi:hypothetical protein
MVFHLMSNLNTYWVPCHFCGFSKMKWYHYVTSFHFTKWNEMMGAKRALRYIHDCYIFWIGSLDLFAWETCGWAGGNATGRVAERKPEAGKLAKQLGGEPAKAILATQVGGVAWPGPHRSKEWVATERRGRGRGRDASRAARRRGDRHNSSRAHQRRQVA